MGTYSVYPTGTTIYNREKACNGYTVYHAFDGAVVIDMNGRVVHAWKGLNGSPCRLLPGGYMMGTVNQPVIAARYEGGKTDLPDLSKEELVEVDWDGNVTWRKRVAQHHDFQIAGNPVGYPVPGMEMRRPGGSGMLVLANCFNRFPAQPERPFVDDVIYEYDENGNEIWSWNVLDHMDELGLTQAAKETAKRYPDDWAHLNAASYVGENRIYDSGDTRFAPENIIVSSRTLSIVFIIERATGKIVFRKGPAEVAETLAARKAQGLPGLEADDPGLLIGQHHAHIIPKGLPGAGNMLLYDNGGFAGYGRESVCSPNGTEKLKRHYSRVLEIDPVSWKIVWRYQADANPVAASGLFSPLLGSAQRLPNGNTLLTEGCFGRVMEVTADGEVVWEYISNLTSPFPIMGLRNIVYRAYRVPYDYLPFVPQPEEISLAPVDNFRFQVPGSVSDMEIPEAMAVAPVF